MKTIVAIGGGKFGRDDEPYETQIIDQKIVELTKKESPDALFIPTASNDAEGYIELFKRNFGGKLQCKVDVLRVYDNANTKEEIKNKINHADIIYVGGGNTVSMMKIWKDLNIDKLLLDAYEKGTIISGLSAGAICWFQNILSDYLKFENPDASLSFLPGLNFSPLTISPHYNSEPERRPGFRNALRGTNLVGFGIDDNAALILSEDEISVIQCNQNSHVWLCFWNNGRYMESPLEIDEKIKIGDLNILKRMIVDGKLTSVAT